MILYYGLYSSSMACRTRAATEIRQEAQLPQRDSASAHVFLGSLADRTRLRNDLYCVGWGVKLYSIQTLIVHFTEHRIYCCTTIIIID